VFFDLVTTPLRGKRLNDWCEELRLRLNDLSEKVSELTPEALAKNEAFVSAFAQASQVALKTHQAEKLEALRNVVLNIALGHCPADDLQTIFLNLVDSFTTVHLQLLRFYQNRNPVDQQRFRSQRYVSDQATMDLLSRGLIQDTRPIAARNRDFDESAVNGDWPTSSLGKQFLELVSNPQELARK
jgi:hypothetical protein